MMGFFWALKKKDDALANGIERAARFVLVFSAHGHVARHERRRGHVLFFPSIDGGSQKRRTRVLVSDSNKTKGAHHHNPPPHVTRETKRKSKTERKTYIIYTL